MSQLIGAGVHFGHQTRRWNPKMKRFIHGDIGGIYIIDLKQTLQRVREAYIFVRNVVANGGTLLFVGTKKQIQNSTAMHARRCGMPYVNERWLGGMLTNIETIFKRVRKMQEYQRMQKSGEFEAMPKKEALSLRRELAKLERNLGGIGQMDTPPEAVFVLDTKTEHIAVSEANKLRIPLIAVVDTNCDPDVVEYVIPGNDDSIRSGDLMCRIMADAVIAGKKFGVFDVEAEAPAPIPSAPAESAVSEEPEEEGVSILAEAAAAVPAVEDEPAKPGSADAIEATVADPRTAEPAPVEPEPVVEPAPPAPPVDSEPAVDAEIAVEPEPVVEPAPPVDSEPAVDAEVAVEPEPAVDAAPDSLDPAEGQEPSDSADAVSEIAADASEEASPLEVSPAEPPASEPEGAAQAEEGVPLEPQAPTVEAPEPAAIPLKADDQGEQPSGVEEVPAAPEPAEVEEPKVQTREDPASEEEAPPTADSGDESKEPVGRVPKKSIFGRRRKSR